MAKKKMTIDDFAALMQRTMASKEDLERFATKEDLERFATKEDLERFATKEDFRQLEQKMDVGFLTVNARIDDLRGDISDLPDMREELQDLGVRMDRVERKVGVAR